MTTINLSKEQRTIAGFINSIEPLEVEGLVVRRLFPKTAFSNFGLFLLS